MTTNVTTDPAAWRAARLAHLEAEKAFTRQRDALSAARRELPWLEIETDYRFDAPAGEVSLLDLFGLRGPRPSGGERE
ncbi:MAG: DUF899 family protein, partial [Acidimicrobiales bacterium]|nr:DUF899 family protein [Acidimicrobiales bacterium]